MSARAERRASGDGAGPARAASANTGKKTRPPVQKIFEAVELDGLLTALGRRGFETIGPTLRDGTIVLAEVKKAADLARNVAVECGAGSYRVAPSGDGAIFPYAGSQDSWKSFLLPPRLPFLRATRRGEELVMETEPDEPPRRAFVGVRACDLAAITILDRVFLEGPYVDPRYARRRAGTFIVAVSCTEPGGTCFCASMHTGPQLSGPADLALTELLSQGRHLFLAEPGTPIGQEVLGEITTRAATAEEVAEARACVTAAAARMPRSVATEGMKERLFAALDHPRYEETGRRCLACASCTMVCPTCFCTTVEELSDLSGRAAVRSRVWDSCFNEAFTLTSGAAIRVSTKSRYRQWLTHKFAAWIDQFGVPGCVGCGRCITWCPVGIDVTEELDAIAVAPEPALASEDEP